MDFYNSEVERPLQTSNAQYLQAYKDLSQAVVQALKIRTLKTSQVMFLLQEHGLNLGDVYQVIFWPRMSREFPKKNLRMVTSHLVKKNWLEPLLKDLRGDFSYAEVANILGVSSLATFHHWEMGRREIPLHYFLMIIDKFYGRLQAFLDNLPLDLNLAQFELLRLKPKLYHQFFSLPWMPTIMLALRLPKLVKMSSIQNQVTYLAKNLNRSTHEIEEALGILMHLKLVKIENGRLHSQPQQFYAIPAIAPEKVEELLNFWFSQVLTMSKKPGFHKFEQHATTFESKEKIIQWITELREKIKGEVKSSGEPETLIHINWQVAEIL